jgi:hypothetical protein
MEIFNTEKLCFEKWKNLEIKSFEFYLLVKKIQSHHKYYTVD